MYPTLVIVLVETQLSMMDICNINSSNASKFWDPVASEASLGHLSFAVEPVHIERQITTLESQCSRASQSGRKLEHGLEEIILE